MTRLAKLFKLLKTKNTIVTQFSTRLKIDQGQERLVFLGLFLIFFFHITTCFFVIIAQLVEGDEVSPDPDNPKSWLTGEGLMVDTGKIDPATNGPMFMIENIKVAYSTALYFTVTTVSTVGYGDITASNPFEMVYSIILMLVGVLIFTFVSGALSSILSNYDSQQAVLQEKLLYLNKLRNQY